MMNKTDYLMISICFVFVLMGSFSGLGLVSAVDAEMIESSGGEIALTDGVGSSEGEGLSPECEAISNELQSSMIKNDKLYSEIYKKHKNFEDAQKEIEELDKKLGVDKLIEKFEACMGDDMVVISDSFEMKDFEKIDGVKKINSETKEVNSGVKEKPKTNSNVGVGIFLLVLAVTIGGLMFFFLGKKKNDEFRL